MHALAHYNSEHQLFVEVFIFVGLLLLFVTYLCVEESNHRATVLGSAFSQASVECIPVMSSSCLHEQCCSGDAPLMSALEDEF